MLTELVEYGHKVKEEVKAIQSEIRKIYREPTVKGKKPGLKSTIRTEGRNKHSTRKE